MKDIQNQSMMTNKCWIWATNSTHLWCSKSKNVTITSRGSFSFWSVDSQRVSGSLRASTTLLHYQKLPWRLSPVFFWAAPIPAAPTKESMLHLAMLSLSSHWKLFTVSHFCKHVYHSHHLCCCSFKDLSRKAISFFASASFSANETAQLGLVYNHPGFS